MYKIIFFVLLALLSTSSTTYSAQSSADVSVPSETKDTLLKDILGENFNKVERSTPYVIGHGDILTVSIFEEGDMSASSVPNAGRAGQTGDAPRTAATGTAVMMDGRISLKNIGDVEVVGLTLTELADYLKQLYSTIFEDPIITTTLVQSNSLRYTVMGEVTNPGIFFLDYPMTTIQVIARSGGFTQWANRKITVVRKNVQPGEKEIFKNNTCELDYDDFISGKHLDRNIFVQADDIIIIH